MNLYQWIFIGGIALFIGFMIVIAKSAFLDLDDHD